MKKYNGDSYECQYYILNFLCDNLYDYYDRTYCSSKKIEKNCTINIEEAGAKKYVAS